MRARSTSGWCISLPYRSRWAEATGDPPRFPLDPDARSPAVEWRCTAGPAGSDLPARTPSGRAATGAVWHVSCACSSPSITPHKQTRQRSWVSSCESVRQGMVPSAWAVAASAPSSSSSYFSGCWDTSSNRSRRVGLRRLQRVRAARVPTFGCVQSPRSTLFRIGYPSAGGLKHLSPVRRSSGRAATAVVARLLNFCR